MQMTGLDVCTVLSDLIHIYYFCCLLTDQLFPYIIPGYTRFPTEEPLMFTGARLFTDWICFVSPNQQCQSTALV